MSFKLDVKDLKMLSVLDENCRLSNTQIAKKVALSKPAVEYRLKRFKANNVVFSFYTIIDFSKLGYSQYKIYFKFQNVSINDEKLIFDYWINSKNSIWVGKIRGHWDMSVSILAKSNFEFGQLLNRFMKQFSHFILSKDVLLTEYSSIYARKYLSETQPSEFVYGLPSKITSVDSVDEAILKIVSVDARIGIVELMKKTGLSRDVVIYRLKKMQSFGLINQFRCYPNLSLLGINLYKIILRTKNFGPSEEMKLKGFISQHKKITQFLKLIGSWDVELEIEVANEDELYIHLNDFRNKFSDIIRDFDIIRVVETVKYNFFPF